MSTEPIAKVPSSGGCWWEGLWGLIFCRLFLAPFECVQKIALQLELEQKSDCIPNSIIKHLCDKCPPPPKKQNKTIKDSPVSHECSVVMDGT